MTPVWCITDDGDVFDLRQELTAPDVWLVEDERDDLEARGAYDESEAE